MGNVESTEQEGKGGLATGGWSAGTGARLRALFRPWPRPAQHGPAPWRAALAIPARTLPLLTRHGAPPGGSACIPVPRRLPRAPRLPQKSSSSRLQSPAGGSARRSLTQRSSVSSASTMARFRAPPCPSTPAHSPARRLFASSCIASNTIGRTRRAACGCSIISVRPRLHNRRHESQRMPLRASWGSWTTRCRPRGPRFGTTRPDASLYNSWSDLGE